MNKKTKVNAFDVVFKELKDAGLEPQALKDGTGYVVGFAEDIYEGGIFNIFEDDSRIVFYLDFADQVPKAALSEVAEFITRANDGILIGYFEMDYKQRTVRYKTSLDFQDEELSKALVRNLLVAARDGAESYADALIQVIKGKKKAKQMIDEIEEPIE